MDEKTKHYLECIKSYEPDIDIEKYDTNYSDGWHNDIIIINDLFVFRFAKLDWTVGLLEYEAKVLEVLHSYIDLTVPKFEMITKGVVKYKYIPGNPIFRDDLLLKDDDTQEKAAMKLGIFLKQIHSIPVSDFEQIGINVSEAYSAANTTYDPAMKSYNDIKEQLFPHMRGYTQKVIEKYYNPLFHDKHFLDYDPVLIHADLAPYHILCDHNMDITGVIDFGVSRLGDPAMDIGLILDCLGEGFIKRMSRYYPEMDKVINRARFYASTMRLIWELRALESGKVKWTVFHMMGAKDVYPIVYS